MSIDTPSAESAPRGPSAATVDMKLELVVIRVADADRSTAFYTGRGAS